MHQKSHGNDGLCRSIFHVLCVETQLLSITRTANAILSSINETIEAVCQLHSRTDSIDSTLVRFQIQSSHGTEACNDEHTHWSHLQRPYTPSSELHDIYVAQNNINGVSARRNVSRIVLVVVLRLLF